MTNGLFNLLQLGSQGYPYVDASIGLECLRDDFTLWDTKTNEGVEQAAPWEPLLMSNSTLGR